MKIAKIRTRHLARALLLLPSLLSIVISADDVAAAEQVNIYSYRQIHLVRPLLDQFEKQTGIRTNFAYRKDGIAERLQLEGTNSPADLILTSDIFRLAELRDKGLTQAVNSPNLRRQIPANLRDPENHWFGLTKRARLIYASDNPKRAPVNEVQSYQDLAKSGLGKRICIRPLSHIYNLGLISSLIALEGAATAADWLNGLKNNLARRPQGNDRAQIKAISQGACDYAIANSYYFALLAAEDTKWTKNIRVIKPTHQEGGTHINISGMALARHAPNTQSAIKLMEFLAGTWAQEYYASVNNEFPVVVGVSASKFLTETFGEPEAQQLTIDDIAKFGPAAQELVNQARIDN